MGGRPVQAIVLGWELRPAILLEKEYLIEYFILSSRQDFFSLSPLEK